MSFFVAIAVRYLLVVLFFPFSALDKIINFKGAVGQAKELVHNEPAAVALILVGLCVEVVMPVGILTGVADRLAAFVMAGYCGVTALLWKQWWRPGDFWAPGESKARNLFWDFLKNYSLAGGFLLLAFGLHVGDFARFVADPLASSHPYAEAAQGGTASR
jgi:putative oxidoreductase